MAYGPAAGGPIRLGSGAARPPAAGCAMAELDLNSEQAPEIPDKLYFRIGEVSRLVGVQPYVLRYWESEFPALAPKKSGTGHRLYRRKEVELLLEIKRLLYQKRYTIEGARRYLETLGKQTRQQRAEKPQPCGQGDLFAAAAPGLEHIRKELSAILDLLK
jgi:DNA-binding transcriptional MerR regulator